MFQYLDPYMDATVIRWTEVSAQWLSYIFVLDVIKMFSQPVHQGALRLPYILLVAMQTSDEID